jgi:hypothetical protein
MIKQLSPPIPLDTPKGAAMAHLVIDYGPEHELHWVCANISDGECWTWTNRHVRFQPNVTLGRHTNAYAQLEQRNGQDS